MVTGDYIAVKDSAGRTQLAELVEDRDRAAGRSLTPPDMVWWVEVHTGPDSWLRTGRRNFVELRADEAGFYLFSKDEASRYLDGYQRAREQARDMGHTFYDGIVLGDEPRQSVLHLDNGWETQQRERGNAHGRGMEQSW